MTEYVSIKKNKDFRRVYAEAKSYANSDLVVYFLPNGTDPTRFGISISSKVGNAVARNKIKRQIKEILRHNLDIIRKGYDIIFIVRIRCKTASFAQITGSVMHLLKKHAWPKDDGQVFAHAQINDVIHKILSKIYTPLLGAHCRFEPTCSQYSYEAFEKYGFFKGFYLTVKRLIRCHPYSTGGYDPVP
jgi:ribonuclease P protein component/putative membrane protein insertion efficiency factor